MYFTYMEKDTKSFQHKYNDTKNELIGYIIWKIIEFFRGLLVPMLGGYVFLHTILWHFVYVYFGLIYFYDYVLETLTILVLV